MFYKRPSLRRGGMPTGIESLTPRVKAQNGFNSFLNNFILGDKFKTNTVPVSETNQKVGIEEIYKDKKPRFEFNQTNEPLSIEDFYKVESDRRKKKAENIFEFMKAKPIKVDGKTYDITGGEEIISSPNFDNFASAREKMTKIPNYNEIAAKIVPNKGDVDTSKDTQPSGEVEEDPFKTEYEKQYERLEKYLGPDKSEDKGRLALALSEAIGTPGSLADKASVLNKSLLNIMAGRKKDKKDLARLAYSATVELEKANIAAGKKSFEERRYEKLFDSAEIIRNPDKYSESEVKAAKSYLENTSAIQNLLKDKKGDFTLTGSTLVGIVDNVPKTQKKLAKELAKGEDADQSKIAQYQKELEIANAILSKDLSAVQEALNFAKGGRVNYAMGTPNPNTQTMDKTPTASVDRLDYNALRTRLPKEISDDIIRLLANDDQALQDFAYIKTQGDVGKFNLKYGVNLVLPPESV